MRQHQNGRFFTILIGLLSTTTISLYSQGFSPDTETRLQQVLVNFQNNSQPAFVGGISAAVNVDGLAFWEGATGYAARNVDAQNNLLPGGTTFTTSTLSRSYSVTKTFTATLVLELAKQGSFSLDDPIGQYMPYMGAYNPSLNSSVTIRQLLNHESGYSDWEESLQLQMAIAFDPTHEWTPYELMVFTEQLSLPGTVRRYSHNNFVFLGAIIEAATGRAVEELFRERFFEPLGLQSIYFEGREPHGNRPLLASPHDNISPFNPIFQYTGQPTFPNTYTNISAFPYNAITSLGFTGGALISNAADLAKWSNALFGGRITSAGILDSLLNSISPIPDEFGNKLGYGLKNTPHISGEYDFIGHNGSAPGYRSAMFYNADRKMSIVVLTNFAGVSPYDIAKALFEALPEFICGYENRKEYKIQLCQQGKNICVDRGSAHTIIARGAYLGGCEPSSSATAISKNENPLVAPDHTELKVFPNPATNRVSIIFSSSQGGPVKAGLYDLAGKLVKTLYDKNLERSSQEKIDVETASLKSGIYIIRLQTSHSVKIQKLVINH